MQPPTQSGRSRSAQPKCTPPTLVRQDTTCTCGTEDELMSIIEVAKRLCIARSTTYDIVVNRQEIPYVKISSRIIRVRRGDLDAYLEANRYGRAAS